MAQTIEIKKYCYYLFSSREDATPIIKLYDVNNKNFANVWFEGGSQPLPDAKQLDNGKYILYYRRSALSDMVDMLRNEKPVYLIWQPKGTQNTRISTSSEPVGEGEQF